jgi:hypothetical protein
MTAFSGRMTPRRGEMTRWPSTNNANVVLFAKELDAAFETLEEQYQTGEICVFMYIGSVEAAEAVEHLLMKRPGIRVVINMFWSYNFDQNDPVYHQT